MIYGVGLKNIIRNADKKSVADPEIGNNTAKNADKTGPD